MTTNLLASIWFIVGFLLIVVEFFAPQLILIFFGVSALITGSLVLLGLPQHSAIPYAVFAGTSLLLLLILRRLAKRLFQGFTSDVTTSEPGFEDVIGSQAVVESGFEGNDLRGRVSFRGTEWNAESVEFLQRGTRVIISARENHILKIVKI